MNQMARFCRHPAGLPVKKSNLTKVDQITGLPMMLVKKSCFICGNKYRDWIYIKKNEFDELSTGKSVLCKWENVK